MRAFDLRLARALEIRQATCLPYNPGTARCSGLVSSAEPNDQAFVAASASTLPFPEKLRRAIDFRGQTFVHRTIKRGLLEHFSML
jgi:hypothetical protein